MLRTKQQRAKGLQESSISCFTQQVSIKIHVVLTINLFEEVLALKFGLFKLILSLNC